MSCNTCVRQAIPAMSGVGVPHTQSHAAWGGTSWRCPVCGKWTDQSNVCTDPECLGRVEDARVDEGALVISRCPGFCTDSGRQNLTRGERSRCAGPSMLVTTW